MSKFLKDSFSNGNRYTNVTVTIILILIGIIGFFLKDIYADFKDVKNVINKHETQIKVLEAKVGSPHERIQ
jgi:cell division protein FtsB